MAKGRESLDKEELSNLLQFSTGLYQALSRGYYTPYTQRDNLIARNGSVDKPKYEDVLKQLGSHSADYTRLAEWVDFEATYSAIYGKILRYYAGLLSWDLTFTCTNIKDPSEYKSQKYQQDYQRLQKFFMAFDYKRNFQKILDIMLRRDVVYTWFRGTSNSLNEPINLNDKYAEKFALQILDSDYCTIDGAYSSGYLFSMDIGSLFDRPDVCIDNYPNWLKIKYKELLSNPKQTYNPSAPVNKRGGTYASQYVQIPVSEGGYVFKLDESTFAQIPLFANLLPTLLMNEDVDKLQHDKNMISAYQLLAGSIEMIKDAQAKKQNNFAIDPNTMGAFLGFVAQGLHNNIKPIAMPVEDLKAWSYQDANPSMQLNSLKAVTGQAVSAGNMIFTSEPHSQFALMEAEQTDYAIMERVYAQFETFLEYFVNRKMSKYHWQFSLSGLNRSWARKEKSEQIGKLATMGLTLPPQFFASTIGCDPFMFTNALKEAHNMGLNEDYLTLLLNANTMKDGSDNQGVGRPQNEIGTGSDKTEANQSL